MMLTLVIAIVVCALIYVAYRINALETEMRSFVEAWHEPPPPQLIDLPDDMKLYYSEEEPPVPVPPMPSPTNPPVCLMKRNVSPENTPDVLATTAPMPQASECIHVLLDGEEAPPTPPHTPSHVPRITHGHGELETAASEEESGESEDTYIQEEPPPTPSPKPTPKPTPKPLKSRPKRNTK